MPVYEYQCTECGQIEEALQKFSDPALTTCPHCKGNLKKMISQSSFHLKGSGWYVTDYGGSKTGIKTGTDAITGTETKTETKVEKKPEKLSKDSKTTSKKTTDSKN